MRRRLADQVHELHALLAKLAQGLPPRPDSNLVCFTFQQADDSRFFPATGHTVSGEFLEFWGQHGGALPTVVGGDFNLTFNGSPDVQDCVPPAWYRKGDGDVQHIMATDNLTFDTSELFPMEFTDHDAWRVPGA